MSVARVASIVLARRYIEVLVHPAWHAGKWGYVSALEQEGGMGTVDVPEEVHDLRKAIRDLRYTAEVLEPATSGHLDEFIQALKKWQDTLGSMHDAHILATRVSRWRGRLPRVEAEIALRFRDNRRQWGADRVRFLDEGAAFELQFPTPAPSSPSRQHQGAPPRRPLVHKRKK